MIKNIDLKNILDDDILDVIYMGRVEDLSIIAKKDKENLKDLLKKRKNSYEQIEIAINNIPNAFTETRKMIIESIESYLEIVNIVGSYENETFYKCGFRDGINIISN